MIIRTPKLTRNYILLKKGGYRLFDSNDVLIKKENNKNIPKTISKEIKILIDNKEVDKNSEEKDKIISKSLTTKTINKKSIKNKKLEDYKKNLFRKNILSTEKNYLLKDYMQKKELDLMSLGGRRTMYEIRKTFFNDDKKKVNRRNYFYVPNSFDKTTKFTLMIKDIESNFILLKNKKNKRYKTYKMNEGSENLKSSYKDFNEKLGVKNVYFKTENYFNKKNPFHNNKFKFLSLFSGFNKFSTGNNNIFNQKSNKL